MDLESPAGSPPPSSPSRPSRTHWLLLTAILSLAAAIVLPPLVNISRYKRRIAASISASIGRPVHMSTVRLHLLPSPGFEISEFEVEEDPSFGEEPMLRSPSVVASIRLSSLWRRRLEISRISLDEPSLNLVRDGQGRWNFDSVLLKTSQSEIAPTVQHLPGAAPRFPYVVAQNARINFKQGAEKKPLSFLNADVSIWLAQPGQWRLRFEAQPVRTDLDLALSDTGLVRIDGTFSQAAGFRRLPTVLHVEWVRAPLGQLSRLLAGRDMGWRGDLDVRADITSTAEHTQLITARIRANGVHRLEFVPLDPLDMDVACTGSYLGATSSLEDLACTSPIGNGKLMVVGAIQALSSKPQPDLQLHLEQVPIAAVLESIRSVRSDFAPDLRVRGSVDGDFHYGPLAGLSGAVLNGSATVNALQLSSPEFQQPLLVNQCKLVAADRKPPEAPRPGHRGRSKTTASSPPEFAETTLILPPFALTGAGASALVADGRFTSKQFTVHLAGDASVRNLAAIGRNFGILSSALVPLARQGTARVDLSIHGPWLLPVADVEHRATVDTAQGTIELRNARITPDFLPAPVEVVSATATFRGDQVVWAPMVFTYAGLSGVGELSYRMPCWGAKGCDATFALNFPSLNAARAQAALLGASEREVALKDLLARIDGRTRPWPRVSGTVDAGTLTVAELVVRDARASIAIDGGHVQISSLDGRTLGGTLHASGALDASGSKPHYAGDVTLSKASAAEIAALFHERWGSGVITLATHLDLIGYTGDELVSSAHGGYQWDWTHGGFSADPALAFSHFDGWRADGAIADKGLTLEHSTLNAGGHAFPVKGTISFDRALKIRLGDGVSATLVSGTAQQPHIERAASLSIVKRPARTRR